MNTPGPLYLLACEIARKAFPRQDWLSLDTTGSSPEQRAAMWARRVLGVPADGRVHGDDGFVDPLATWVSFIGFPSDAPAATQPPWLELALLVVDAAHPGSADVEGDSTDAEREAERARNARLAWERIERRLADYLPRALTLTGIA